MHFQTNTTAIQTTLVEKAWEVATGGKSHPDLFHASVPSTLPSFEQRGAVNDALIQRTVIGIGAHRFQSSHHIRLANGHMGYEARFLCACRF